MPIAHIVYERGCLRLLDQTRLPDEVQTLELREWPQVAEAIEAMRVRGAPAIGIAAAYGMALAADQYASRADFTIRMTHAGAGLTKTRPTAVNLSWAVTRVLNEIRSLPAGAAPETRVAAAETTAHRIHEEDIAACRRIGDAGAALLPLDATVLTHCNTGTLATGGYGTALGIVRSAWRDGKLRRVLVDETRPLLQGARLTAWELLQDEIPFSLIADAMAASFIGRGAVQAVVVGADRIAANGDVANKIGTYGLAVLAHAHDVPFIVAAPRSTIDRSLAGGASIPIEERDPSEVTQVRGRHIAPAGTPAENPAFDVTPATLVSAIVTELGVLRPPFDRAIASLGDAEAVVR